MRSLYKRQLTMMVGVMVLSFTLLSTAFMLLSYRYIISEKRDAMARNASYIATFTASYYQQYDSIQDKIYSNYVASIARISDSYVIVTTPDGEIIYATDGDHLYDYKNTCLPKAVVDQVLHDGDYTGMTNLDGIYPERRYMAALPVSAMTGTGIGGCLQPGGDVVGHGHHFLLLRRGGADYLRHCQYHHLRPSGPAPERDGRGRPKVWPGGVRRAGPRL